MAQPERLRFAPSPTGDLHVGGARAALFNWLYAKKTGGQFLLRIEDTDTERSTEAALSSILESLRWLGLGWDEELVFQSKRAELYRSAVDNLLAGGLAYPCFCTVEELDAEREHARANKLNYHYSGTCRDLDTETVDRFMREGRPYTVRFRVPPGATSFDDLVHGPTLFQNETIGDFIIARADGSPVYLLGVAVDDGDMNITLVMRGDDHISNTPKQIMLMQALGHDIPRFAHLPQVLGEDMKKLSKRHGAASVIEYRRMGFLPAALVNFLALLGWNPGDDREKMSLDELIEAFSIPQISKKSGVFDMKKLEWLNGLYLAEQTSESLLELAGSLLVEKNLVSADELVTRRQYILEVIELIKTRCRLVTDIPDMAEYFFTAPENYEEKGVNKHFKGDAATYLDALADHFEELETFSVESAEEAIRVLADELGVGGGKLIHPTRLAVTGRTFGPGLFELLVLVGQDEVVARIRRGAVYVRTYADG